ncbi:2-dehydro-3-deoxyphosphogluconate aldolase / (4S)-4-hydroxy-2-oxoglutarate aldolase [Anaerocolumna xylanovorans DSM 12503]|uniref:2-dehydro-3-deoxyphosphogluconate aldolase / (4S)-4-hydroxy-2-oxoglutarate aldolase n=2 Tax=Anaerocolumna TaxID=1843210 RepID=A0A1M7YDF2_9FIRM|nr:2-dehydro-3-deoxyphosphogluconate aldolase / (4S)-4-hydroxy-2-oxoglutarate aldolase [Anaerocolumna xylanovorans DSM 12503]
MVGGKVERSMVIRMKDIEALQTIEKYGIVAIVRGTEINQMKRIAAALYEGGVRVIEVTFNTEKAESLLKELTDEFSDRMLIGAGTILDSESARTAILAGAKFILSPSLNPEVLKICQRYSILAVPGVMTPTEAVQAWELGARMIKIFPAVNLGPSYVKQILGPLNQLNIMVVGGINENNLGAFLENGASCAGIGGDLVNKQEIEEGKYEELVQKAVRFQSIFENKKMNGGKE